LTAWLAGGFGDSRLSWRAGIRQQSAGKYSDRLAALARASDNLFNVTGNPLIGAGLGTFTLDSEPLVEADFAAPTNLSGAWVTSFSSLTLPAGAYWWMASNATAAPDFQNSVAALPPDFDAGQEWMISFSDLSFRLRIIGISYVSHSLHPASGIG
jgi:hypothetical protein